MASAEPHPTNDLPYLMMTSTLIRRAAVAFTAVTLACGDSTGPANLSEEQVGDMLEAMSAVSSFGTEAGPGMAALSSPGSALANVVVTVSQTVDCPNGGSASVNGTVDENEQAGTATVQITQSFSACAATSSRGRVWTFDGNPNIVTNVSASNNETTGAFSMTATQVGGIRFTSDLGSGSCQVNLTITLSGDANSFQGGMSGSACGHNIEQSFSVSQ